MPPGPNYDPRGVPKRLLPIAPAFHPPAPSPPPFGHALRPFFYTPKGWRAMNNGSCGTCPRVVQEAFVEWNRVAEENTDLFFRLTYTHQQNHVRKRLAEEILHCDPDDVVFTLNATLGVNCILRSIFWEPEDVIIFYGSAYSACSATVAFLLDANPQLEMERIDIAYPLPNSKLLTKTEAAIKGILARGKKPRLFMFDAITSVPGVAVPWEDLVTMCRTYQILSLVDAAHAVGQIPLDLRLTRPDFFVSNCHKWLFAHRASCVLYADKSVQHLVQSVPTNASYVRRGDVFSPDDSWSTRSAFVTSFEWSSTVDLSGYLSTDVALDFRQWLGGEAKIRSYAHKIAKEGGRLMAEILGTETMEASEEETELVACMTNVRIPTPTGSRKDEWRKIIGPILLERYQTFVPIYVHNGALWGRVSGQIYLELSDFEYLGKAIKEICSELSLS